jgi:hypothetical protein
MPGRWTTLAIVLFWLAMMSWLTGRELWKRYGPPPRLTDMLREASNDGPTRWKISHNFERIGWAETDVVAFEDGRYQLRQRVHFNQASRFFEIIGLPLGLLFPEAATTPGDGQVIYNLTPQGHLESLLFEILRSPSDSRDAILRFEGTPEQNQLRIKATSPLLPTASVDWSIPYDARNVLHNSLCPLDRMPGLWPGRRWQAPLVDPARTLAAQLLERAPVEVVVRDEPQNLYWQGLRDWVSCLVADARLPDQDMHIEIWVHQGDGLVLKQRARWGSRVLEVERADVPAGFRQE